MGEFIFFLIGFFTGIFAAHYEYRSRIRQLEKDVALWQGKYTGIIIKLQEKVKKYSPT